MPNGAVSIDLGLGASCCRFATGDLHACTGAKRSNITSQQPIPLLAYYYIWFDPGSWNRAKVDYPLLGRYSSDDKKVMGGAYSGGQESWYQWLYR